MKFMHACISSGRERDEESQPDSDKETAIEGCVEGRLIMVFNYST